MINAKEEAERIYEWVANTQFSIVSDSNGNLIKKRELKGVIRHRAITYVDFCLNDRCSDDKVRELNDIRDELSQLF